VARSVGRGPAVVGHRSSATRGSSAPPDPIVAKAVRALKKIAIARSGRIVADDDLRDGGPTSGYADIQELLLHRDPAARRRQLLIERVLEQLEAGRRVDRVDSPSPLQQELRMIVSATGEGGGRFAVANETAEPVMIRFEPQPIRSADRSLVKGANVSFTPATVSLGVGDTTTIAILVQVDPSDLCHGMELAVRVLANDRVLGRLWVELLPTPLARES
jgi:hypothetical protein